MVLTLKKEGKKKRHPKKELKYRAKNAKNKPKYKRQNLSLDEKEYYKMFYLIVAIAIIKFCFRESWKELYEYIFKEDKTTLIGVIGLFFVAFAIFGYGFGLYKPNYVQTDSAVYELMEYDDIQYSIKDEDRIEVMFFKDGYFEVEKFDRDIVKINISNNSNEQATVKIIKGKKVEPSIFEKVFFLKGYLWDDEKSISVLLSLPNNSKITNK